MTMHEPTHSRRHFLVSVGAAGFAGWIAPTALFHRALDPRLRQESIVEKVRRAAATDPMTVQELRRKVSVVVGSGANIAVLPGPDGVVLVDSGIVGRRVAASVGRISQAPITQVINTHWHFDHTDANAWMHARGATITAHENTRKHLSTSTRVEDWSFSFPPSARAAIPTSVLATEHSLQLNGSRIEVIYYGPAHTDSDVSVHFTDADVLNVGDTWWNGLYPFIDYSTGGSIDGMIRASDATIARAAADTIIVPGHGPVGNKDQLTRYRDMLVTVRDRVAALKAQGRPLADVVAAKPTAEFDASWSWSIIDPASFVRLVYRGV